MIRRCMRSDGRKSNHPAVRKMLVRNDSTDVPLQSTSGGQSDRSIKLLFTVYKNLIRPARITSHTARRGRRSIDNRRYSRPTRDDRRDNLTRKLIATVTALVSTAIAVAAGKTEIDYGRDVRPILSENCFHCHGQDSKKRMAGLRLDSFEGATADRGSHAALVPASRKRAQSTSGLRRPGRQADAAGLFQSAPDRRPDCDSRALDRGRRQVRKHWAFVPPSPACRCRKSQIEPGSSSRSTPLF